MWLDCRVLLGGLLILGIVACGVMGAPPREDRERPVVGAIRWDAWYGGAVTAEVERSLGPENFHERLPWFARVEEGGKVRIDGDRASVMAREIEFAAGAGLDYWAFVGYAKGDGMSRGLQLYLESADRGKVKFCLILHRNLAVDAREWPAEKARAVALLKEAGYQQVMGGRPLVFALDVPAERFAEFREAAAGLHPYCVYMGWDPGEDYAWAAKQGYDAVSAYAYGSSAASYADLATAVERDYWGKAASAKVPYIPLVTTGWDKRPRQEHPVSWEQGADYLRQKVFPAAARPEEIAGHLKRALAFVREEPAVCESGAVLMYAWNEFDEGGWIEPTWRAEGVNAERVEAVGKVLKVDR